MTQMIGPGFFTVAGQAPAEFLNSNDRRHHMAQAALVKLWRQDAWARYNALPNPKPKPTSLATASLAIGTNKPDKRRDPMNWWPTFKALIDGLTDAHVWPDDDSTRVLIVQPRFVPEVVLPDGHYRLSVTWETDD